MKILELYQKYKIMLNLQQHQLRVASVGMFLCDHCSLAEVRAEREVMKEALLLHDMGNIIKFDLHFFPEFLKPEGLEHWQKVQSEFKEKYGNNAHKATMQILEEIGVSERVSELVNAVSFAKAKQTFESTDFSRKICAYSDMRVGPHGVISLQERFEDGQKRYAPKDGKKNSFEYVLQAFYKKIEKQLFEAEDVEAEDVQEKSVSNYLTEISGTPSTIN